MNLAAGIDIGSTTTKVVLMEDSKVAASEVAATGANCRRTVAALLDQALKALCRTTEDIAYVATTGYGRRMIDFADEVVTEISANAKGAKWLGQGAQIRTIVDIGGQDSKVISLDENGVMANFAMNDRCAAGTGRFLEVMSRVLEVHLDELGGLSLESGTPLPINSLCTVFAESEVISLLAQGKEVKDIIAGIHESIAKRVGALIRNVGLEEAVFFDGGPALNKGLTKALERELGVALIVPQFPQVATAIGAALIASDHLAKSGRGKGIDLTMAEKVAVE